MLSPTCFTREREERLPIFSFLLGLGVIDHSARSVTVQGDPMTHVAVVGGAVDHGKLNGSLDKLPQPLLRKQRPPTGLTQAIIAASHNLCVTQELGASATLTAPRVFFDPLLAATTPPNLKLVCGSA
jgi:hypothetical protein